MRGGRKIWLMALAATAVYGAFFLLFCDGIDRDPITRYAVMAEELAAGNFVEAYHPRYCMLLQTLAGGLVWLFGLSGLAACQLVATAGWCLAAIPLWHVARRLADERAAWLAAALLLVVPAFFNDAGSGMRDSLRILSYMLMALGFLSASRWMAAGLFLSATLRVDGIVVAGMVLTVYVVEKVRRREFRAVVLPVVSMIVGLLADSAAVWLVTGHFVPTSHFLRLFGAGEAAAVAPVAANLPVSTPDPGLVREISRPERQREESLAWYFMALVVVSLVGFALRLRWRRTVRGEWAVPMLIVMPSLLVFAMCVALTDETTVYWRYHYPAYALGLVYVGGLLAPLLARFRGGVLVASVFVAVLFADNFRHYWRHYLRPDRADDAAVLAADKWAAELIRRDWKGPARTTPGSDLEYYVPSRLPVVYCLNSPRAAYWAGGRTFEPWKAERGLEVLPDYWLCPCGDEKFIGRYYDRPPMERIGEFRTKKKAFVLYRTIRMRQPEVREGL